MQMRAPPCGTFSSSTGKGVSEEFKKLRKAARSAQAASDDELRKQAEAFGKANNCTVRVDTMAHLQMPAKVAAEAQSQSGHDMYRTASADPFLYENLLVTMDDVVEKGGKGLAFASATWHFSTEKLPEEGARPWPEEIAMSPEIRAREGVFLAFQYPVEIPGVTNAYFLRAAYNENLPKVTQYWTELGQNQAQEPAADGNEDRHRHRGGAPRRPARPRSSPPASR